MKRALQPWFEGLRRGAALAVIVLGLLNGGVALLGGVAPPSGLGSMTLVGSIMVVLAGLSLALHGLPSRLAAAPVLIGGLVLSTGLAHSPPLSQAVALNALLCGTALFFRELPRPRLVWAMQLLVLVLIVNETRILLDLLVGLFPGTDGVRVHPGGSVPREIAGILCGLGVLAARPDAGFMALFASSSPAGRLLRRLVLVGVAVPVVLGVATEYGIRTGALNLFLGLMVLVLCNLFLLYRLAAAYARADSARQGAEDRLARANAELEGRVAERTAALEEREAQLRAIGDNLPGTMIFCYGRAHDERPHFLYLSAGVERISGLNARVVCDNPELLYSQLEPDSYRAFMAQRSASRASGQLVDLEVRKATPHGRRWSRIRARPRRLGDGRVVWDGIEVDITDQKEAQARIEQDRRAQAALFACSRALLVAADSEAERAAALQEALHQLLAGTRIDRALLMRHIEHPELGPCFELIAVAWAPGIQPQPEQQPNEPPLPMALFDEPFRQQFASDQPFFVDLTALSTVPLAQEIVARLDIRSMVGLPIWIGGQLWGGLGIQAVGAERAWDEQEIVMARTVADLIRGAVQRWADEDELRAREKLLATLFDILPAAVALVNKQILPVQVNQAAVALSGLDQQTLLAGDFDQLLLVAADGTLAVDAYTTIGRAIAGEVVRDVELALTRPDGCQRLVSISAAPLPVEGLAAVVVALDVTERRRIEEERLAFERKLLETQRLESLGVLAGGVAHDFNNILTAIQGHAELARFDTPPGDAAASLDAIVLGARRAADLTAQMLAFAGRGRFVSEEVQLNQVADELRELTRATIPPAVQVRYALADGLPPVVADPTQVRQVLLNLITNAAEAISGTGRGGTISVSTGVARLDAAALDRAAFSAARPGPCCYVQVSDTGAGMDQETMARIFEPFYSTKFTGRGLGLAAVQGIVRAHSGALFVQSAPGQGALFRVCFPLAPIPDSRAPAAPNLTPVAPR